MKWHNLNIGVKISINTGTGLLLWAAGFFGLVYLAAHYPAVERIFPVALAGWTGGFISFLLKRNSNNKIDLEAAKVGVVKDTNG